MFLSLSSAFTEGGVRDMILQALEYEFPMQSDFNIHWQDNSGCCYPDERTGR